jgi:predicted RNA-binding protein with RPS1 domain
MLSIRSHSAEKADVARLYNRFLKRSLRTTHNENIVWQLFLLPLNSRHCVSLWCKFRRGHRCGPVLSVIKFKNKKTKGMKRSIVFGDPNSIMAQLMASEAAQPLQLEPGKTVRATYLGRGLVTISGSKHDLPLHKMDNAKDIEPGFTADAVLMQIRKGSVETDPTVEDGSGICVSFKMAIIAEERRQRFENVAVDELVTGKVVRIIKAGAIVDIGCGVTGLVHISELVRGADLQQGSSIDVVVTRKDKESGRISLSQRRGVRRAFVRDIAVGEEFAGEARTVKNYGVFVQIAPGVAGLLHSSRIGKGFTEANAASMLPNPLRVKVIKISDDGERIDLALA